MLLINGVMTSFSGDSETVNVPLYKRGVHPSFWATADLFFTAKTSRDDLDAAAVIQKFTGTGITESSAVATLEFVPFDTVEQEDVTLYCDIRGADPDTGERHTGASFTWKLGKPVTKESDPSITIYTTEPYNTAERLENYGAEVNEVTQLKCAAYQRVVLTKNAWNTVSTLTGSGAITKTWIAVAMATAGDPVVRNTLIRITFNGAATAQIGGSSDVTLEDFFCSGLGLDREFRSERIGISNNDASNFGGHFKQQMPFTDGCVIELKPIGTTGTVWFYGMIQYTVGHFSSGMINRNWVLHVDTNVYEYVAFDEINHVILNTSAATKLLGLNHRIDHSVAYDNVYLEHDYLISDDGGATNFWTSSGTEDMFGGAFYFEQEPLYQDNDNGIICRPLDAGATQYKFSGYMFWDNHALPSGGSELKFSWSSVNDPLSLPDVNLTSRATVFYYQAT